MNAPHRNTPVLTQLYAFWHWLMGRPHSIAQAPVVLPLPEQQSCTLPDQMLTPASCDSSRSAMRQPLRVWRVMDAGMSPVQTGRLRISGRMADVCAELDRLAALESSYR